MHRFLFAIAACISLPINALAGSFSLENQTVLIRPSGGASGVVEIAGEIKPVSPKIGIRVGKRETITVLIDQANPVLFAYEARDPTREKTENYDAALKFFDALKGFYGVLQPSETRDARPTSVVIEDLDVGEFLDNAAKVLNRPDDAKEMIDRTAEQDNGNSVAADKNIVAEWNSFELMQTINGQMEEARQILGKQLAGVEINFTIDGVRQTPQLSIDKIAEKIGSPLGDRLRAFPAVVLEKEQFVARARLLAEFEAAFMRIGSQEKMTEFAYDPKYIVSQKVVVSGNERFEPLLSAKAKAFREERSGSIELVAEPEASLHLRIAPGIVYSFVRDPKFSVAENDTGLLFVSRSENGVAALSGAVALNIIPDRYFGEGTEPFLQVGVAPTSDSPAVFLGIGIQAFDKVLFSLGAVYQRVNSLGGRLAVGDELATVNDLVTDEEWKTGLYLSIGVSLGE